MLHLPKRVLGFDLETGGDNPKYDGVRQIGAVVMEGDSILSAPFCTKVRPKNPNTHKISRGALEAQCGDLETPEGQSKAAEYFATMMTWPLASDATNAFMDWAEAEGATLLPIVAHVAAFDIGFWAQHTFEQKGRLQRAGMGVISICTMQLMRVLAPGGKSYSLDNCLLLAGLPARPSDHNALQDAILAGRLYHFARTELIKRGLAE